MPLEKLGPLLVWGFFGTTLLTIYLVRTAVLASDHDSARKMARLTLSLSALWIVLHGYLAMSQFYLRVDVLPPRLLLAIVPMLLLGLLLITLKKPQSFLQSIPLSSLVWISAVRIPVELVLWGMAYAEMVPQVMTFEGLNFDILAGLTAIPLALLLQKDPVKYRKAALTWNVVGLLLLLNIIVHAFLSAPTPLQQIAFDQPNWGILVVPFVWLPAYVAPVVLISHLLMLRRLLGKPLG